MDVEFYKYHGAGNDFVIVDDRDKTFPESNRLEIVQQICKRHFGVGSDGLILIQEDGEHDFFMEFYNPDGSQSFCGNGSRCAVMFAFHMGITGEECSFNSIHGVNKGVVVDSNNVSLNMFDVNNIEIGEDYQYMNTGSPHYNVYVDSVEDVELLTLARDIRYGDRFKKEGTNVNTIEKVALNTIKVRTYERGVEGETLSCGTGVTACAISYLISSGIEEGRVSVTTKGGELVVDITSCKQDKVTGIRLTGPAEFVFKGEIDV